MTAASVLLAITSGREPGSDTDSDQDRSSARPDVAAAWLKELPVDQLFLSAEPKRDGDCSDARFDSLLARCDFKRTPEA